MDQLLQKLAISKKIMDKHNEIGRGKSDSNYSVPQPSFQDFNTPQAKYNIPEEFLQEKTQTPYVSEIPRENTKPVGVPSIDAIKNSKLPDEIKKLMMEHPISQPQQPNVTLSNDLIERAARLMKEQKGGYVPESAKPKKVSQEPNNSNSGIDYNIIKKMIQEAVDNALSKNGLLVESTENSNEIFSFRVGKHIFEGKVTKIKKIS